MRRNGKKWLAVLMLIFLLSGCLPAGASAEKKLTWPSGVKVVGEHMFEGDTSIETVVLPEGVEGIGSRAFAGSSLKEIYLPSTLDLSQVAEDAFEDCDNFQTAHAPWECGEIRSWLREKGLLAEYRALVIGEKTFGNQKASRNEADANHMEAMLNSVSGLTGVEDHFTVTKKIDLTYEGIELAIRDTFEGTQPQDISLFFIATHGVEYTGDLAMSNWERNLSIATLADWLNTYVQGKVIVILESCYAGYAIYTPEIQENNRKGSNSQMYSAMNSEPSVLSGGDYFAELAVQVFAEKDPGVRVGQGPAGSDGGLRKNSGEMRVENKFYVLAASRHNEESFGYAGTSDDNPGNLFTIWLLEGVGKKNKSPADTSPKDSALTLKELFNYINKYSKEPIYHKELDDDGITIIVKSYQHVQCYPKDCNFICFLLR